MMKKVLSAIYRLLTKPFRWYVSLFKGRPWYMKMLWTVMSFIVFVILYLGAVDINFLGLFGQTPSMATIKKTRPAQASEIYSCDSVLLGKFFSENRTPVKYEEVAPVFWQALTDTEDERFYSHYGVDIAAVVAALKDYIFGNSARGASTLTQQLAKNLFRTRTDYSTGLLGEVPGLRMLVVKSKEWVTALKLEWNFTKEEILTMYANTVDFGSNAYGIKTAARTYFGVMPSELKPEQAAVLVGMLKATTIYNPRLNPQNAMARRNTVLANMVRNGHITQQQYDSLSTMPIVLKFSKESIYDGKAQYFREALQDNIQEWCNSHNIDPYTAGLKIYTTLDSRLQDYAEQAAWQQMREIQQSFNEHWEGMNPWQDAYHREIPHFIEDLAQRLPIYRELERQFPDCPDSVWQRLSTPHDMRLFSYDGPVDTLMSTLDSLRYICRFMHCGFIAIEPHTGHVKAWVGDVDYDTWKYDKVTALRQPGSTFKLFVYTEAMNQGMTPCKPYMDTNYNIHGWTPHNASGRVSEATMTLRSAFAQSVNTIAARLGQDVGIEWVARTAHAMGINSHLEELPSLALGASDVCLLELVNAYCTVANYGRRHTPVFVTHIIDRDGNEIHRPQNEQHEAIPYRSAFFMQRMLMGGLNGTSWSLRNYVGNHLADTDFGGKTGTSNNHSDAWFVGVSPMLACGAWVGGEYRSIHFRTGALGQGSRTALPICGRFLQAVMDDPRFPHYHRHFDECTDPNIQTSQYECYNHVDPLENIMNFNLVMFDSISDEVFIDEPAYHPRQPYDEEPEPVIPQNTPTDATENE